MKQGSIPKQSVRRLPRQVQLAGVMSLMAIVSLVSSLGFLMMTTVRLNQTDISHQEGQLLNRISIEQAATLLQEQTVVFDQE